MSEEIKEKLKQVFLNYFKEVKEDSFDLGKERTEFENWDSLTHMQIVSEIESTFSISFEMDEIADINKPEDFVVLILKKQNG